LVADAATTLAISSVASTSSTSSEAATTEASITAEAAATVAAKSASSAEASTATEASRTSWRTKTARAGRARRRTLSIASSTQAAAIAPRTPSGYSATTLDVDENTAVPEFDTICLFVSGLHVLLALVNDESIAALALLQGRVARRGDILDDSNALNGTVATELALEVLFGDVVSKTGDEKRLEGVALDFGVFAGFI
jgi:hypothetical protein